VGETYIQMILLRKLGGKRSIGRPRPRWMDIIRMDVTEIVRGATG
jgi:hypothetical protein